KSIAIENVTTLTIDTMFPQAWKQYFNNTLQKVGLNYGSNQDYIISYSLENEWVSIIFTNDEILRKMTVSVKNLAAQLSPGWIQ
ncbi:MAG: hypothetical protein KAR20_05940, partial [Candidatus Heimdallarchaeota archaeon]|nr:hypothetical protein [Candidatus Heimdallarchaeota archaeon]